MNGVVWRFRMDREELIIRAQLQLPWPAASVPFEVRLTSFEVRLTLGWELSTSGRSRA